MNREDQEALTRVGRGTPMGELLRRYWLPCALSADLVAGGSIRRLTLLGEALVLLRDPDGVVVAHAAACPHRGVSLHLGRNERDGVRCVYHGWKFDRAGRCRDMPNEPPELRFCDKVRLPTWPATERAGVVWLYLGPHAKPPALPELEWNLPGSPRPFLHASVRHCNWVQALEGDLDSSHLGILHARWDDASAPTVPGAAMPGPWPDAMRMLRGLGPPHVEVVDTEVGALYSARRARPDGRDYHRVHPFLFPFHTMVGGAVEGSLAEARPSPGEPTAFSGKAWVPIDDVRTWVLEWQLRPDAPWSDDELAALRGARYPFGDAAPGPDSDYGRDRALEAERQFFGVVSNPLQDRAVEESMGAIADRTHEHLGPADAMIIRVRRRLLAAAHILKDTGIEPPGVARPELYRVRPVGALLPAGADWVAATRERREGRASGGVR